MTKQLDGLTIVIMLTRLNEEKMALNPPTSPLNVSDPELQRMADAEAWRSAYQYDMYQDITHLAFYDGTRSHHATVRPAIAPDGVASNKQSIIYVPTEEELVKWAGLMLTTGKEYGMTYAGWKLSTDVWPHLINKCFKYGVSVPASYKVNPGKRWSNVDCLLDVSNIYTQGVSTSMRRLPALCNVLDCCWGEKDAYKQISEIHNLAETDAIAASTELDKYLTAMYRVVCRYTD